MAAPPNYSDTVLEQQFYNVFPAHYRHDIELQLTGSSLLVLERLVGSDRYMEVAKSLVFRIYAFLDGARSYGVLDPYKAWSVDVRDTDTDTTDSRVWTTVCAVWIKPTTPEQIAHHPTLFGGLGTSRAGVPRPRGVFRVPKSFYVAAASGSNHVQYVTFLGGQSHHMADEPHWGNIAYQGLFKHLSEARDGSQSWELHWHLPSTRARNQTRFFEVKTDPTCLFEPSTLSLRCYFEEHPYAVQGRT
ncbi:regulatory protein E2 [Rhodotorula toruloides]|uniref:Regulatory protein E2 n=1 Tax=Rhodotorula toruloides TaxID=5286 RepID=A0A511KGQ1_RHOTO|nr:regulatory protein E2 [Rhodotorula toruloides]